MVTTAASGVGNCLKANMELGNSASYRSCFLIGHLKLQNHWIVAKRRQLDVKNKLKTCIKRPSTVNLANGIQSGFIPVAWCCFRHSFSFLVSLLAFPAAFVCAFSGFPFFPEETDSKYVTFPINAAV